MQKYFTSIFTDKKDGLSPHNAEVWREENEIWNNEQSQAKWMWKKYKFHENFVGKNIQYGP